MLGYVQKLEITNARGNVLSLNIEEDDGPYQISSIEGLDPGKATLVSSNSAGADGAVFQSATRPPRNVKINLDLDPDFDETTYESARTELYKWFMPKAKIRQTYYMSTGLSLNIDGIVESNDSPIFDEDPDVSVSLMCFDPDFIDDQVVSLDWTSVDDITNLPIEYPGTIDAGTIVTLHVNRNIDGFSIYNTVEEGLTYQLDFSGILLNGDVLVISSLKGNKGITLTRAGISSSFLFGRSSQSSWINLENGTNQFRVFAEGDPIPYTLEYAVRYGGL